MTSLLLLLLLLAQTQDYLQYIISYFDLQDDNSNLINSIRTLVNLNIYPFCSPGINIQLL